MRGGRRMGGEGVQGCSALPPRRLSPDIQPQSFLVCPRETHNQNRPSAKRHWANSILAFAGTPSKTFIKEIYPVIWARSSSHRTRKGLPVRIWRPQQPRARTSQLRAPERRSASVAKRLHSTRLRYQKSKLTGKIRNFPPFQLFFQRPGTEIDQINQVGQSNSKSPCIPTRVRTAGGARCCHLELNPLDTSCLNIFSLLLFLQEKFYSVTTIQKFCTLAINPLSKANQQNLRVTYSMTLEWWNLEYEMILKGGSFTAWKGTSFWGV